MKEIKLLHPPKGPFIFKRMVDDIPQNIEKGDVVRVRNKNGQIFGYAFYNPDSNITFRLITRSFDENFNVEEYIYNAIIKAKRYRDIFNLPSQDTNVFRLIYDWGDGLSGLVCDIFGSFAVFDLYSYAYFKRMNFLKKIMREIIDLEDIFFTSSSYTQTMERFHLNNTKEKKIKVKENGIFFEIKIGSGYKTGFFCDQRENRKYISNFSKNKKVLDLFAYTGGFGIYAKKAGAEEVRCIELDEDACNMAKRNANINSLKISVIRADAFTYLRQMISNREFFDIVISDPYKFVSSNETKDEGLKKYFDINRLAMSIVKSNGILVTCSCSGMISFEEFIDIVKNAASSAKRIVKIFKKSGAGPDHPFMVNWQEGEYLKVLWCYVE